jgi:hypothetical protein
MRILKFQYGNRHLKSWLHGKFLGSLPQGAVGKRGPHDETTGIYGANPTPLAHGIRGREAGEKPLPSSID